MNTGSKILFAVRNWTFRIVNQTGFAIQDIDLSLHEGETMALIGESGAGKSLLAQSFLGFFPPMARDKRGELLFQDQSFRIDEEVHFRKIRGCGLFLLPQNGSAALNPVLPVGSFLADLLDAHFQDDQPEKLRLVARALRAVGFPDPERIQRSYPHQLSGGMAQRVLIAGALLLRPAVVLADEATASLDVVSEQLVLETLFSLQKEMGFGVLLITHNLPLAMKYSSRIAIMKSGRIIEAGPTDEILAKPVNEYTRRFIETVIDATRNKII